MGLSRSGGGWEMGSDERVSIWGTWVPRVTDETRMKGRQDRNS